MTPLLPARTSEHRPRDHITAQTDELEERSIDRHKRLLGPVKRKRWIADQLGHSLAVLLSTYAHLIDEYAEAPNIDADAEIAEARRQVGVHPVYTAAR